MAGRGSPGKVQQIRNKSKTPKQPTTENGKLRNVLTMLKRTFHWSVAILDFACLVWWAYETHMESQLPENLTAEFYTHGLRFLPFYFSFWVWMLRFVYFCIYAAIDYLELQSAKGKDSHATIQQLHSAASHLLFTGVFPLSLTVGILFWTFFHWDRTTIFPENLELRTGEWPNHMMHTLPVPLSVVYMFVSNKEEPPRNVTLSCLVAFLGVYACMVLSIKSHTGKWIYLCLENLQPNLVPLALTFGAVSPLFFHSLGYKINNLANSLKKKIQF